MKIICFGDSNTWGYDPRGYFAGRYDHPWPEILAEKLGCNVVNQGENGRMIPTCDVAFPADADLLIIMLGTNDLLHGASSDTVCAEMERFLRYLDPAKVLLMAPPPMKRGAWVSDPGLIEDSLALAKCYESMAKRLSIRYADAGQWNVPLAYDGVHLGEEGHAIFAESLYRELMGP